MLEESLSPSEGGPRVANCGAATTPAWGMQYGFLGGKFFLSQNLPTFFSVPSCVS